MMRFIANCILLVMVLGLLGTCQADTIVLPPINPNLPPLGLVLVQGAQIDNSLYVPLAKEIQTNLASRYALWVTMPSYPINLPLPIGPLFNGPINDAMNKAYDAGLPKGTPFSCLGHSLGAASLQDFVFNNPTACNSQILTGASLLRKYRNATTSGKPYPVPTMSLTGELDGLMRISRMAEAYWHQILHPTSADAQDPEDFPVVVIPGMNHMQVASGSPPYLVQQRDLKSEITEDEAHQAIAAIVGPFMAIHASATPSPSDIQIIVTAVQATGNLVGPLVTSLEMEGSYKLMPPCNSDHPAPHCPYYAAYPVPKTVRTPWDNDWCTCGCPWTEQFAQNIMADVPEQYKVVAVDAFHDVTNIMPFHHPHLWTNCSTATSFPCILNVSTASENRYEKLDDWDTGFASISAYEIRVKIRSRQSFHSASFNTSAAYDDLDNKKNSNFCAQINQFAIDWAMKNAGSKTVQRFQSFGQPMVTGDDILPIIPAGPVWINNALHLDNDKDASGNLVLRVSSPSFISSLDGKDIWLDPPLLSGYHYCKLLSPARAMEWLYVDGLRAHMPITGSQ